MTKMNLYRSSEIAIFVQWYGESPRNKIVESFASYSWTPGSCTDEIVTVYAYSFDSQHVRLLLSNG